MEENFRIMLAMNLKNQEDYNSFIMFEESAKDIVHENLLPLFEIELLSKEVEVMPDGMIKYKFNVTEEKEIEIKELLTHQVNQIIVDENTTSLN